MSVRISALIAMTAALILLAGCNQGRSVVEPGAGSLQLLNEQAGPESEGSHQCLGLYTIAIDTMNSTVDVAPVRSSAFHVNVVSILNTTMGVSAVSVPGESDPPTGLFAFDITLEHPFTSADQLAGFDVKGILITPGTLTLGALRFANFNETRLENADGFTRWWNPGEFTTTGLLGYTHGNLANQPPAALTANVNPYKLFADILDATTGLDTATNEPLTNPGGRAVFTAGSENTRRYMIRFPMNPGPVVKYGYAVDASWMQPSPNPPTEVPDNFPIEANQPEAYRIAVSPTVNTLYFDDESGVGGGVLRLRIDVYDWQGQAVGDIPPQINGVSIFSPGLLSSGTSATFNDKTAFKSTYLADLTGKAVPKQAGRVSIIFSILSAGTTNYKQGPQTAPDSPVSAYQVVVLDVPDPECMGDANNEFNEAMNLDLTQPTIDQLCAPSDYRDFFKLEVPLGYEVSGQITLYCDVEPTKFSLYDESETLVTETSVADGSAVIDLAALSLIPGTYYFRVLTQSSGQAFEYMIDPDAQLDNVTPTNAQLVTPPDLYFAPRYVTMHGDIAYATGQYGLWILDYSNLVTPQLLSFLDITCFGYCEPALSYPFLYFYRADISGTWYIDVVDVTDPANPILHSGVLEFTDPVSCLEAESDWLYVGFSDMSAIHRVEIYDISGDHTQPVYENSFDTVEGAAQLELIYDQGSPTYWLSVMCSTPRIEYFDVTDKLAIASTGGYLLNPSFQLLDTTSQGNYSYLLAEASSDYLYVFSLQPGSANYEGFGDITGSGEPVTIAYDANFVYVAENDTTIRIVDVSVPANPFVYNWLGAGLAGVIDLYSQDSVLLCAQENAGLRGMSITTPGSPANAGKVLGLGMPVNFTISGDRLFAAEYYGYSAIKTVDISDPANAYVVNELELQTKPNLVRTSGDRMLATSLYGSSLIAIDSTNPDNLVYLNTFAAGGYILGLTIRGDNAYLATDQKELETWNLAMWPAIGMMNSQDLPDYGTELLMKDDILYMIVGGEIRIYSLVNPGYPEYIDTYTPLSTAWRIAIQGDYLYIATDGSLEIADISVPQTPTFVASEPHPDAPMGRFLAVDGQFAYLQPLGGEPPTVMRIWPPTDPTVIGDLYPNTGDNQVYQTFVYNGYCIERDFNHAINIWDLY